jgi:putative transposase
MAIYEALDIRKERIDPRQSWQNYIEAHFGIMRRLADYYLNKAPTLDEMKKAHRKFIRDYNCQIHFAHRERQDNRHSPQDVLRGAKQEVEVSFYTSTLKIEYQETELAFYTIEWAQDNKHIKEVKNPRLIETGYQSPQLKLWTLGPDEWLLFLKLPDYAARTRRRTLETNIVQLPLPDPDENQRQQVFL